MALFSAEPLGGLRFLSYTAIQAATVTPWEQQPRGTLSARLQEETGRLARLLRRFGGIHSIAGCPFFLSFVLSALVLRELVAQLSSPHRVSDLVYLVPFLSICTLGFLQLQRASHPFSLIN